ncbi:MAG: hypothetical protein LBH32_00205 [Dysgonamonadaceae bacterium]|jgi:hypothetical protein|nr:hypothetical protein [Dysgonamonadaceae bacterium]
MNKILFKDSVFHFLHFSICHTLHLGACLAESKALVCNKMQSRVNNFYERNRQVPGSQPEGSYSGMETHYEGQTKGLFANESFYE